MADQENSRKLRIKLGSLKRLHKEYLSYITETEAHKAKVDQLKIQNAEDYVVQKQQELLQDAEQMIPNSKNRLEAAYEDLSAWLQENGQDQSLQELLAESQSLMTTVKELFESGAQLSQ